VTFANISRPLHSTAGLPGEQAGHIVLQHRISLRIEVLPGEVESRIGLPYVGRSFRTVAHVPLQAHCIGLPALG